MSSPTKYSTGYFYNIPTPPPSPTRARAGSDAYHLRNLTTNHWNFPNPSSSESNHLSGAISNTRYIGSYNWVSNIATPALIVPGCPREWTERPLPHTISPDRDGHYRDQFDHRMRATPLMPLFIAVNNWQARQGTQFPWHSTDFVTSRSSLRTLLRFIQDAKCPAFRIDLELAGNNTILLSQWNNHQKKDYFFPNSYGFNFENTFTKEVDQVAHLEADGESGRHLRIISYDFGGLKMVVRSETDACLPQQHASHTPPGHFAIRSPQVTNAQYGLSIIPSTNSPPSQADIVELATSASPGPLSPDYSAFKQTTNDKRRYAQLFFSQTPHYFIASHTHGNISHIAKHHLESPHFLSIANGFEDDMRRLRKLLDDIQNVVAAVARYRSRSSGPWRNVLTSNDIPQTNHRSFSLVYFDNQLCLFERVGARCLPTEAFSLFETNDGGGMTMTPAVVAPGPPYN